MTANTNEKLIVFPMTSEINHKGQLQIAGCNSMNLVKRYGTPLYVFDDFTIRNKCRQFQNEFRKYYPDSSILYASKAFTNRVIATIIMEEGMGLDVVSGGELSIASSIGFPREKIYFHGNNKTEKEILEALEYGIGRFVVDNFYELDLLNKLAGSKNIRQDILLRLSPGIDAHTHKFTTTGILDSKFGFSMVTGHAEEAVSKAMSAVNLNLVGLHCHLGSPIFETDPYVLAIDYVLKFASEMKSRYGFVMKEFSPGGGFAVQYLREKPAPPVSEYAESITATLINAINKYQLEKPLLLLEPGRSIIAQAGVAFYTVGSIKEIPSVRTYVCVDGGMGDNIRPALYEARYEALIANKASSEETMLITIAGKYCESGDILIKDASVTPVISGDIIAIPVSGAYCIPMSSNYNMVPRPPVVLVKEGKAQLIRKRETYRDLY